MTTAPGRPAAILAAGLCLLLAACGPAVPGATAEKAPPAPRTAPAQVPVLTARVTDEANVLSPDAEQQLTELSQGLEQRRTDQFVIVTVPSLEGRTIEDYSLDRFNASRIGRADVNNGVMILVAPSEQRVRIATGSGMEAILPDTVCAEIIENEILSRFRQNDLEGGITAGARAIVARLDQAPPWPPLSTASTAPSASQPARPARPEPAK